MDLELIFGLVLAVVVGVGSFVAGYFLQRSFASAQIKTQTAEAQKQLAEAEARSKDIILKAKDEALKYRDEVDNDLKKKRVDLQREDERLRHRRESIDRRQEMQEQRDKKLEKKEKDLDQIREALVANEAKQLQELQRISGLTIEEAKAILLHQVEKETRQDAARLIREIEQEAREDGERRAREIITTAIERVSSDQVAETTVALVPLPNDEMKGRIIGRQGRNIRAIEVATGVDLVVDDTPEAVILSSHNPVRREVARVALTKLISDGRIHPGRIEKIVEKAEEEVNAAIVEAGDQAALEVGVTGLHPEILKLLGQLKYRTSYGQNVLAHVIECAHLAGMMASELKADVQLAKAGALLHDIGKAVTHEVGGAHALIGVEYARKYGVPEKVANIIASHHGEEESQSLEAIIVLSADAISGARPGARRESLEQYLKRVEALETMANAFSGVQQSYAIQAGREIRIIVKPEEIDDLGAINLCKQIARKVEDNLEYPGQIKVTVVRETRSIEFAK
ncbi:MAG: ribonuclease Y [Chloroflexota bacterium]|nr:ribonuclease Y [Chloroflexota bacterium]